MKRNSFLHHINITINRIKCEDISQERLHILYLKNCNEFHLHFSSQFSHIMSYQIDWTLYIRKYVYLDFLKITKASI